MDYVQMILASLIVFLAFFIKGMSGFANALIMVPLLALFLDLRIVVPLSAMLSVVSHIILLPSVRKQISSESLFVVIFVMIGTFIGVHFLVTYSSAFLKTILGISIIAFSIQMLLNKTFENIAKWWGAVAGIIAGIFGGMFTTNGPPLVIYFGNKLKKQSFRATLIMIFLIDSVWMNILLINNGVLNVNILVMSLTLMPALLLGIFLGTKVHYKIDEVMFKKVIAIILLVVGVTFIF